jgi:hypothetical protein
MSAAGWASCLDSFADHLAYQREALAAGTPELITPFVPSQDLGALPVGLLARAKALQAQAESLTEAISEARTRTQAALADLHRPSQPARPSFIDSRA